jgi:DNA-binding NtrC family response regulator
VGVIELPHLPVEVVGAQLEPVAEYGTDRPPSMQAPLPEGMDLDDEADGFDDHLATENVSNSDGFRRAVREVEQLVDEWDALEATDPAARSQLAGAAKGTSGPPSWEGPTHQGKGASSDSAEVRPPSAYHDMGELERSYASAVDPDVIVEALRKGRGNVSAAARYLGKPRALVLRWMREFRIDPNRYRE